MLLIMAKQTTKPKSRFVKKVGRPKKVHAGGRPRSITESVLDKLKQAFSVGATDLEACAVAGISKDTLYNYQKENPRFLEQKQKLKTMPTYAAKIAVVEKLYHKDIDTSKWYLERRSPEFSNKQKIEHSGGVSLLLLHEQFDRQSTQIEPGDTGSL